MTNGYGVIVGEAWGVQQEKDAVGHPTGVFIWTTPTGHHYRSEPETELDPWRGIDPWTGMAEGESPGDVVPFE